MSEVAGHELADAMEGYSFAYLMTVTKDGEAHAVAVQPQLRDGAVQLGGVGSRSRANIADRPNVSLVWPPSDFDGYSLIVNGVAVDGDSMVTVAPTRAVLHRPHDHDAHKAAGTGCGSDCVPLDLG